MTIFVKAAKALIDRALIKSIEDSIAEDKRMFFSMFRDPELSDKQRELTRELQKLIDAFLAKSDDKESLDALKELISKTDNIVEDHRKTKKWPRGHLNKTLISINSNLDRFFHTISTKSFPLINIPDNEDTFNILCAHGTYYLGENILLPPEEGVFTKMLGKVTSVITGTSAVVIRGQKEDCLIKHLAKCKVKLDVLDTEKDVDEEVRKTLVTEQIDLILTENAGICEESKPLSGGIPVTLTIFAVANVKAPGMKPSRGRLRVAMENALEEIGESVKSELALN